MRNMKWRTASPGECLIEEEEERKVQGILPEKKKKKSKSDFKKVTRNIGEKAIAWKVNGPEVPVTAGSS